MRCARAGSRRVEGEAAPARQISGTEGLQTPVVAHSGQGAVIVGHMHARWVLSRIAAAQPACWKPRSLLRCGRYTLIVPTTPLAAVCPFILGNEFCERLAFYG